MPFLVVLALLAAMGESPGAPEPCAAASAALREIHPSDAYRADDPVGMGLRRVGERISPACRRALDAGQWPELAQLFRKLFEMGPRYRTEACWLAPPELLSTIAAWVTTDSESEHVDVECAALLFRSRRADFDATVAPLLRANIHVTQELASRSAPEDRSFFLPLLDAATHERQSGRDDLFRLVCSAAPARTALPCRAPAKLEATWERARRTRRMAVGLAPHVILAAIYVVFVLVIGRRAAREGLKVAAALGSAAAAAALAWLVVASPTPGAGALNGFNALLGLFVTPGAALVGGLIGWGSHRAKIPQRLWCLAHALVYLLLVGAYLARGT